MASSDSRSGQEVNKWNWNILLYKIIQTQKSSQTASGILQDRDVLTGQNWGNLSFISDKNKNELKLIKYI